MEFNFADPEVAQHLDDFKPKVQHNLNLRLSDLDVAALQTSKGKIELQERVAAELNGVLREYAGFGNTSLSGIAAYPNMFSS